MSTTVVEPVICFAYKTPGIKVFEHKEYIFQANEVHYLVSM